MEISTALIFFILFLIVLIWLIISSVRNKIFFKMAFRNFLRKRGSSVVVIVGLMVGTAIISSSFTVGDSFNTLLASEIIDDLQGIDEVYVFQIPGSQETLDFPIEIYRALKYALADDLADEIRYKVSIEQHQKIKIKAEQTKEAVLTFDAETGSVEV